MDFLDILLISFIIISIIGLIVKNYFFDNEIEFLKETLNSDIKSIFHLSNKDNISFSKDVNLTWNKTQFQFTENKVRSSLEDLIESLNAAFPKESIINILEKDEERRLEFKRFITRSRALDNIKSFINLNHNVPIEYRFSVSSIFIEIGKDLVIEIPVNN